MLVFYENFFFGGAPCGAQELFLLYAQEWPMVVFIGPFGTWGLNKVCCVQGKCLPGCTFCLFSIFASADFSSSLMFQADFFFYLRASSLYLQFLCSLFSILPTSRLKGEFPSSLENVTCAQLGEEGREGIIYFLDSLSILQIESTSYK